MHLVGWWRWKFGFVPLRYLGSVMVAMFSAVTSIVVGIALGLFFALPAFTFVDEQGTGSTTNVSS